MTRIAAVIALLAAQAPWCLAAAPYAGGVLRPDVSLDAALFGGTIALDGRLGDYRWDTGPLPLFGAELTARRGAWAAGVRFWRSETSQATGIPGGAPAPSVRLDCAALVGEWRFATLFATELSLSGSAGMLQVAYSPDRIVLSGGGGARIGEPLAVDLEGVREASGSAGLKATRPLPAGAFVSAGVERFYFGFDTAHQADGRIVEEREIFGQWIGSLELGWRIGGP